MRYCLTTLIIMGALAASQAHEFWLQADRYFLRTGERLRIKFMSGENFMGEPWDLKVHRVESLMISEAEAARDLKDSIDLQTGMLSTSFARPGTKLVSMQSNAAFVELESGPFNDYLKEDGLDEVYSQREKTKTLDRKAREHYSRHTKLLVQVGELRDDTFKKVLGMPIELVPQRNPCELRRADKCKFVVLFDGKPLFGAKVRLWNRYDNRTTIQNMYTQQDGTIEMQVSNPGSWMVSVIKMVPSKDPSADWRSYWGSLVFGVRP